MNSRRRAVVVDVVAGGEDGAGDAVEQLRGRLVAGGRAAGDVAGADEHRIAGRWGVVATVIDAVPVTPPVAALMVVVPAPTPVTRPVVDTVATAELPLDQAKVFAAFDGDAVAVSCTLPPTAIVADDGATVIVLTPGPPRASSDSVGATGFCWRSVQESTRAIATVATATDGIRLRVIFWGGSR